MKILLTGASSGIGKSVKRLLPLAHNCEIIVPSRSELDLDMPGVTQSYANHMPADIDVLINCAGHDMGGKVPFVDHAMTQVQNIMQTNLLGPMTLTQAVLRNNPKATIINVTSMNVMRHGNNDLAYTLSKKALHEFTELLRTEYRDARIIEVRPGLVKTNFNQARFEGRAADNLYNNKHMSPDYVADELIRALTVAHITLVEINP